MFILPKIDFFTPKKSPTFEDFGQYLSQDQVEVYNSQTGEKFIALINKTTTCQQNLAETVYTLQYDKAALDRLNLKMKPTIFNGTDVIVGKRKSLNEYVNMKVIVLLTYNDRQVILKSDFPVTLKQGRRIITYVIDHEEVMNKILKDHHYRVPNYTINDVSEENGTLFLSVTLPDTTHKPLYKNKEFIGFIEAPLIYEEHSNRISMVYKHIDEDIIIRHVNVLENEKVLMIHQDVFINDEPAIQVITGFDYDPYQNDPVYMYTQYLEENGITIPERLIQRYLVANRSDKWAK